MMEAAGVRDGTEPVFERLPVELRPSPALLRYYVLVSCLAGPALLFPLVPLFFRYRTLRYRVDEEGITMRWGALLRREVSLHYGRIQDIHLSSNLLERWLGLGKIQVQTASASSKAEMTIEGIPGLDAMRDFLYSRMRGARDGGAPTQAGQGRTGTREVAAAGPGPGLPAVPAVGDQLVAALREVTAEIRALRRDLARSDGPPTAGEADD